MNELTSDLFDSNNHWRSHPELETLNKFVENKDSFKMKLNLAGASKESVNASFDNGMLTVLAKTEDGIDYHYKCHLPNDAADAKKAKAKYENGILSVVIPKHTKAKSISIKVD